MKLKIQTYWSSEKQGQKRSDEVKGGSDDVRRDQMSSGEVRRGQTWSGMCIVQVRSDKIRWGQTRSGEVRQSKTRSGKFRRGQTWSGKVRKGKAKSQEVTRGQATSGEASWGQTSGGGHRRSGVVKQGQLRTVKEDRGGQKMSSKVTKGHSWAQLTNSLASANR